MNEDQSKRRGRSFMAQTSVIYLSNMNVYSQKKARWMKVFEACLTNGDPRITFC